MKAVVSTTYDDKYLFFLPIITYCWNKLGVQVVCFMPGNNIHYTEPRLSLISNTAYRQNLEWEVFNFYCPEHKEATYAQCSRLYAAALDLPEDELLVTSDIDMAVFKMPKFHKSKFTILGSDLVPENQYPICYINATVKNWREVVGIGEKYTGMKTSIPKWPSLKTYQECLDDLLAHIEAEHFRGNYWGKDQEEAHLRIRKFNQQLVNNIQRARPGTQFAMNRVDRDDINWRSYLGPDLIDAHLWRPGYTDENFANILELLQTQYTEDNFQWMIDYRNKYIKLI